MASLLDDNLGHTSIDFDSLIKLGFVPFDRNGHASFANPYYFVKYIPDNKYRSIKLRCEYRIDTKELFVKVLTGEVTNSYFIIKCENLEDIIATIEMTKNEFTR